MLVCCAIVVSRTEHAAAPPHFATIGNVRLKRCSAGSASNWRSSGYNPRHKPHQAIFMPVVNQLDEMPAPTGPMNIALLAARIATAQPPARDSADARR